MEKETVRIGLYYFYSLLLYCLFSEIVIVTSVKRKNSSIYLTERTI